MREITSYRALVAFSILALSGASFGAILPITPGPALLPANNLVLNGSFEKGFSGSPLTGNYWATGAAQSPLQVPTSWTSSGGPGNYAYRADTGYAAGSAPVPDGQLALYFGNGFVTSISETPTFNPNGSVIFTSPTPTLSTNPTLSPPVSIQQTVSGLSTGNKYALSFWASSEDAANATFGHDGIFGLDVTGFDTTFLAAPSGSSGLGAQNVYRFEFQPTSSNTTFAFTNWGHISGAPSVPGAETVGWTIPLNTTELVLDHVILNDLGPIEEEFPEPGMLGALSLALLTLRRSRR